MIFAFIAPLFWAVTAVLDKFLLDKHIKDPYVANIYFNLITFILGLGLVLILFVNLMFPLLYIMLAFITGIIMFLGILMYFKSIQVEDVSTVIPLIFIYPIFAILFAFVFLGEVVGLLQYMGALFLISSSVLVSMRRDFGKIMVSPALKFLVIMNMLLGATVVIEKFALGGMSFWALFFWGNAGVLAGALINLAVSRKSRKGMLRMFKLRKRITGLIWLVSFLNIIALLTFYFALSLGPATLVSSINAVQPFYVLLIVLLLSAFMPRILKEVHTKKTLFLKILAIIAVFFGTYMIAV